MTGINVTIAKKARNEAAALRHEAGISTLSKGKVASLIADAELLEANATRALQGDPEAIEWICGILNLSGDWDKYVLETRKELDSGPGVP